MESPQVKSPAYRNLKNRIKQSPIELKEQIRKVLAIGLALSFVL